MRITNSMMIDNMLRNLNNGLGRVNKYHNQLASNRRMVKLSDDPIGVLNSLGARQQIRRLEQYQRNVDTSRAWVVQSESSVTEMEEAIINAKELLTDAMGTENNDDKKIFATQIREITNTIFQLANSSMGDKYIFGGFNVTKQPFTAEYDETGRMISVAYNGLDLTGKNVTFQNADGTAWKPTFFETGDGVSITNLKWNGQMDLPGEFTAKIATVTPDPDTAPDVERTVIQFTDKATDKTYDAYLDGFPEDPGKLKDGETMKLKLVTKDGENFGTVTWKNVLTDGHGNPVESVSEEQILQSLASGVAGKKLGTSTTMVNSKIVAGPTAPEGLTWTGALQDVEQKYTMDVNGSEITFTNSFGSVVGKVDLAKLTGDDITDPVRLQDPNGKPTDIWSFSANLRDPQSGMDFGTVTYKAAGEPVDFPPGVTSDLDQMAYIIGKAGFVTTNLGEEATERIQFEIGYNMDIDVSFTGIDLVGTGDDNLFNVMLNLADDLDAGMRNEDLTHYLTRLSDVQDRLLNGMMKCGNRTNKLDSMSNRYKFDAINYEQTRSNIEDIDQAEVISKMKYSEMIYKQALASGAQIIQPTLMDFLR